MPPPTPSFPARIVKVFSSFGLATTVLALLLLVTYLGTLEQLEHGLFDSQKKYFESWFITGIDVACCLRAMHIPYSGAFNLPLIMPGGLLLMILLAVNMTLGGLIRLKKEAIWLVKLPLRVLTGRFAELTPAPRAVGVFIAHFSVVFMLFAGLLSLLFKWDGAVALREGESSDEFQSFHDTVIEIERLVPAPADGKRKALVIDGREFQDLTDGKARTFTGAGLPFDLTVMNYLDHCEPRRDSGNAGSRMVADGYYLQATEKKDENGKVLGQERWSDGAYVKAKLKDGTEQTGILWRFAAAPFSLKVGEEVWGISLSRRTRKLPFVVKLDKFEREVHPGTEQASRFTSHVTVFEGGQEHKRVITMNEPLRSNGFAFFQQSFDMREDSKGALITSSTFQVVKNPSDHWPLIGCISAGIGLLIHIIWRLVRYLHLHRSSAAPRAL
jgi:hypothetical protein